MFLTKLLFFSCDLYKDTIGFVKGDALEAKLENIQILFNYYGPGRNVIKQMTHLSMRDPRAGPGAPVQVVPVEALQEQFKKQQEEAMQRQRQQGLPQFMHEPYIRDRDYITSLKEVALRGWNPPSSTRESDEVENETATGDVLDFSDLKIE